MESLAGAREASRGWICRHRADRSKRCVNGATRNRRRQIFREEACGHRAAGRAEVSSRGRWTARTEEQRAGHPPPESRWGLQAHGQPDAAGQRKCCRDQVRPSPENARTAWILWRAAEVTFHGVRGRHGAFRRVVANKNSRVRNENSGAQPVWLCEMPTELLLIFWMRNGVAFPTEIIARAEQWVGTKNG